MKNDVALKVSVALKMLEFPPPQKISNEKKFSRPCKSLNEVKHLFHAYDLWLRHVW